MIDERFPGIAQTLSGALGAAVTIFENGKKAFSTPEDVSSVESLVLHQDFYGGIPHDTGETVSYLTNRYSENFILLSLEGGVEIVFGPFCTVKMTGLGIASLVRETGLPPRCRSKLLDHFVALPVYSVSQYFYIGQLMAVIFGGEGRVSLPDSGAAKSFPSSEFAERRVQNRVAQFTHPPYFLEQELVRAVAAGDKPAAYAVLNELVLVDTPHLSDDPLRSEKNLHITLCAVLARAAINGGAATEDAFNLNDIYVGRIEQLDSIDDVRSTFAEMTDAFIDLVRAVRTRNYSAPIAETVQYIKSHLTDKLTLPELAELVHLHPNYLSSVFKRETGESVTTYILRQRIYEAAHMLQSTDMTASEISSFYLFCNQSYFIKTFRRFMGCSPQQYREQCGDLKRG